MKKIILLLILILYSESIFAEYEPKSIFNFDNYLGFTLSGYYHGIPIGSDKPSLSYPIVFNIDVNISKFLFGMGFCIMDNTINDYRPSEEFDYLLSKKKRNGLMTFNAGYTISRIKIKNTYLNAVLLGSMGLSFTTYDYNYKYIDGSFSEDGESKFFAGIKTRFYLLNSKKVKGTTLHIDIGYDNLTKLGAGIGVCFYWL